MSEYCKNEYGGNWYILWKFQRSGQCSQDWQIWTLACVIRITWQKCWFFSIVYYRGIFKYKAQDIFIQMTDDRNISWLRRQNRGWMCADEETDKNVEDWEEFWIDLKMCRIELCFRLILIPASTYADPVNCTQSMLIIAIHLLLISASKSGTIDLCIFQNDQRFVVLSIRTRNNITQATLV